jgi:hypothetical protein
MNLSLRSLRFYAPILAACILLSIPLALQWRDRYAANFLSASGETQTIEKLVAEQQATQALYGSALFEDDFNYKLELIRVRKPDVVALGSSRALQFREEFFSVPFVTAGRAMNSIPEGSRFIDEMLKIHRPRLVIIALDVWWLNANRREPRTSRRDLTNTRSIISSFWSYVNESKISAVRTLRVVMGGHGNPVSARPAIGIAALARGGGFRPDGSRDYGLRYFGLDPSFEDKKFANARFRVRNGTSLLNFGEDINRERLGQLHEMVVRLKDAGVQVVGVLPPFAPTIIRLIKQKPKQYAYIPKARAAYAALPISVHDFLESRSLQNSDCEFADGLHAGDVTYQRMLLRMAEAAPSGLLTSVTQRPYLETNIRTLAGRAVTPTPADGYRYPEVDFLGIGCRKG